MALGTDELEQIIAAVDEVMGRRMEEVYGAIEQIRGEFTSTVQVLNDNDMAVVAEVQRMKREAPAVLLEQAEASWERFVRDEARQLGLKIMAPKGEG